MSGRCFNSRLPSIPQRSSEARIFSFLRSPCVHLSGLVANDYPVILLVTGEMINLLSCSRIDVAFDHGIVR